MPTWIVTGGAGFIGSNFVRLVHRSRDVRVVVLDKLTYAGSLASLEGVLGDGRVVFVEGDIADASAVRAAEWPHAPQPSAILNFAAETHVDGRLTVRARSCRPTSWARSNSSKGRGTTGRRCPGGTRGVPVPPRLDRRGLRHARRHGALFRRDTLRAPNWPRTRRQSRANHLVRTYRTFGLPVLITNCSNNYGPSRFPEKLIPLMLLNALEGKPLPMLGDGRNVRDWLFVEDHCEGILAMLDRGRLGEKYNIGGGNERENLQIVDRLCEALERQVPAADNRHLLARGITAYAALKTFVRPIGRVMIAGMPSTRRESGVSWAGRPRMRSRPGSSRRSRGTWPIPTGAPPSRPATAASGSAPRADPAPRQPRPAGRWAVSAPRPARSSRFLNR